MPKGPLKSSTKAALQESEALLRTVLDATFEGVLIHDEVIRYANPAAARITGHARRDLVGMPMAKLYGSFIDGDSRSFKNFEPPAEGLLYEPTELMGIGEGTRRARIEAQGKTVLYEGRWLWFTAFRDITRRKSMEEQLQGRVAREDLVSSIASRSIDLRPIEVAAALESALARIGAFEKAACGCIHLFDHDAPRAAHVWISEGILDDSLRTGVAALSLDERVRERLSRGEHIVEPGTACQSTFLCVPMFGSGRLMGAVSLGTTQPADSFGPDTIRSLRTAAYVFASVLERARVQEELDRALASMEQTVEIRTAELQRKQAQLLHADKMAVLGQLVAGVAHEINTPLGAIKSNTDTMMRSLDKLGQAMGPHDDSSVGNVSSVGRDATARRRVERLLETNIKLNGINAQAVERIIGIVSSLRQFARLDQADVDTLDLNEAVDNTLLLVQHQLKHRIHVHKAYGSIPPLQCHPDQVNQVLMNLLVNAGHAIEGKGDIYIRTFRQDDRVAFELRDTGKGIRGEHLPRIFDPGFTTKGVGVGTGLGLSIVQSILDEHHGTIEVESVPYEGTTFRVWFPITHSDETD